MGNRRVELRSEKELQEAVLQEKARGTPDLEIGRKYGVTFRYIEKLITKSQGVNIGALNVSKKVKTLNPRDFEEEKTTVWSFKQRGSWATHSGEYRGNWSPYIPRNVILKYSKRGELVLDYFCGAGTTAVESKLLGRNCIALDINHKAIELAKENLNFGTESRQLSLIDKSSNLKVYEPELSVGDAKNLSFLESNSVHLICAHPPYANIIHYTDSKKGDLSFLDIDAFLKEMSTVAKESFRVLKPGRQCAILIGDTRRKKHIIPLGFGLIDVYLNAGFKLRELVIKRQHNCKTTGFWYANSIKYNFLLLAHEYLPIFEKPKSRTLELKERRIRYGVVVPTSQKPSLKRKLDEIETTTVWVLPEKDFERHLNKNVIDRYSNEKGYATVSLVSHSAKLVDKPLLNKQKHKELLFIKSAILENTRSHSTIESCLQKTEKIVGKALPELANGGFVVVQTQDVRIDEYIEPMAKRVLDMLSFDNLWLKEIIFVTHEGLSSKTQVSGKHLERAHQYLLVYEVVKERK